MRESSNTDLQANWQGGVTDNMETLPMNEMALDSALARAQSMPQSPVSIASSTTLSLGALHEMTQKTPEPKSKSQLISDSQEPTPEDVASGSQELIGHPADSSSAKMTTSTTPSTVSSGNKVNLLALEAGVS